MSLWLWHLCPFLLSCFHTLLMLCVAALVVSTLQQVFDYLHICAWTVAVVSCLSHCCGTVTNVQPLLCAGCQVSGADYMQSCPPKAHGSTSLSRLWLWPLFVWQRHLIPISAIMLCISFWVLMSFSVASKNTGSWVNTDGLGSSVAKAEGAMPRS